jgi:uncharacterized membrane protein
VILKEIKVAYKVSMSIRGVTVYIKLSLNKYIEFVVFRGKNREK